MSLLLQGQKYKTRLTTMVCIAERLQVINEQIADAERRCSRPVGSVQLIAVSKTVSVSIIKRAIDSGQYHFAENYVQEGLAKILEINDSRLEWHFIGRVQSNKAKFIARHFSWVQTVCNEKHVTILDRERPLEMTPLNVCIQLNTSGDATRSGVHFDEVIDLADMISKAKRLKLRGLMCMAPLGASSDELKKVFCRVASLQKKMQAAGYPVNTLSMGMSADFQLAIASGSTHVRVGSAIFGERDQ